ncbi:hypothetical protein H257_11196 [Aphanomyces astaci]|uniref:Amidase domain-containing protein n=1 Tax=Aphanomyces astaci TaxID=112090 RepID=W4G3H4_APHAT|nr:hypothetical protein H257_11196 [Aphanomyces astaci]ETV74262.1 hypothetical protein H257_11196 [Aphanomyces astaci]|eukprot:XP_009836368.1 hypothetical protein H257_11196 [Aphanomyces astaci]
MRIVLPFVLASAFQAALSRTFDTFNYTETTIDKLQDAIVSQKLSVKEIVQHYLDVIDQLNHKGPQLNGVIETSPTALAQAIAQDRNGTRSGLLHGIPILIKDNIATTGDGLTACAGSFAMEGNIAPRDAFLVQKLRAAGAIVLGHANMVEWANWRSVTDTVDWSARGGITKNPYVLTAPTTGSSSDPALTVAANMIPVAIGTESDTSIVAPASFQSVVGLKPTVGLVSRTGVIPLSARQDSPGPMGRTVADVARVLQAIAGFDPTDSASKDAPVPEYSQTYNALTSLKNVRVAISKQANDYTTNENLSPAHVNAFNKGVETLKKLGADIVYAPYPNAAAISKSECDVPMTTEFKVDLEAYLSTLTWKEGVTPMKTLQDITDYNAAHPDTELNVLDQSLMLQSLNSPNKTSSTYLDALALCQDLAVTNGIEKYIKDTQADVIFALTLTWSLAPNSPGYHSIAGWPILSVPLGYDHSVPFGVSFVTPKYHEEKLLQNGYLFEQSTKARVAPQFLPDN